MPTELTLTCRGFVAAGAFAATWLLQLTEPAASGGGKTVGAWTCAPSLLQAGGVCAMTF